MVTNKSWLKSSKAQRNLASAKSYLSEVSSNMLDIVEIEELPIDSEPMQIVHEANEIVNRIDDLQRRVSDLYYNQYNTLING